MATTPHPIMDEGVFAQAQRTAGKRFTSSPHPPHRSQLRLNDTCDSSSGSGITNEPHSSEQQPANSTLKTPPLTRGSSGVVSSANRWFDHSNNEVQEISAPFPEDSPPFFLRNDSSSGTPPEAENQLNPLAGVIESSNSLPPRPGLLRLDTSGSSNEDFRGVIDDLTIENMKLKRRLKRYEMLHDSHLKDEKLFEVRIHGLPPDKKRELEATLRDFAAALGPHHGSSAFPPAGRPVPMPLLNPHKPTSSRLHVQNADSAYASMSVSGQGSSARSGIDSQSKTKMPSAATRFQNIQSSVHSYLHHMSEGLLPQTNPADMSERAKQKLVVQRLEEIFTGKGAAALGHQHPLQQQEVSQIAARDDRWALAASGQREGSEGTREALIVGLVQDDVREDLRDEVQDMAQDESYLATQAPVRLNESGLSAFTREVASHEQRPTRPLDLDPHRAQVPDENMRYIRYLGFSPPDLESSTGKGESHGWIYLNLLIGMAQLHTINVTTDYIRSALSAYSDSFEISEDGRKVRWNSGRSATRTSSDSGVSSYDRHGDDTPRRSPSKRTKLVHRQSGPPSLQARDGARQRLQSEHSRFAYTPLFFHRDSIEEEDDSSLGEEDDDADFPIPDALGDRCTGVTCSGFRQTSFKKRKREKDDGPIIFYNNARFCTDLSGERQPSPNPQAPPYFKASEQSVGEPWRTSEEITESRGFFAEACDFPELMEATASPSCDSMDLTFPQTSLDDSHTPANTKQVHLEVTGIGGVWPADNFAIEVVSRRVRIHQAAESASARPLIRTATRFARVLRGSPLKHNARAAFQEQILSTKYTSLCPSELPPPLSFMPFSEDSLSEDESDYDDDMSDAPGHPHALPPSAAPQAISLHRGNSDEEDDDEEDDDDSDVESDGSLDLLAAAREADPEAVRAKEREYDAAMADRPLEEIPAGSSAATAGRRSGFSSPVLGTINRQYSRVIPEGPGEHSSGSTASSTHGSLIVQGMEDLSGSEDDGGAGMDDVSVES